jgi:murein DD-endopeptidase MepM/ murein hydrolase activator NlpD
MKRTSASEIIASLYGWKLPERENRVRALILFAVFFGFTALVFQAGRFSQDASANLQQNMTALQLEIQSQQGQIDRLTRQNVQNINALGARLSELQAASTRMDALGQRLAQMGQLTLEEFDFSAPPPVGGPGDHETLGPGNENDLRLELASLSERLKRQSSQLDALQFLMMNRQLESDLTPTGWPVRRGWISSRYGERTDPFTGEKVHHSGLDFVGKRGSDVLSVASGVVIWASNKNGYGRTVEIDHGNGYQTRYAHNEAIQVKAGDHVSAGQVIALLGDSGRASAPHVHFEVLLNGNRVNPAKFAGQLR